MNEPPRRAAAERRTKARAAERLPDSVQSGYDLRHPDDRGDVTVAPGSERPVSVAAVTKRVIVPALLDALIESVSEPSK